MVHLAYAPDPQPRAPSAPPDYPVVTSELIRLVERERGTKFRIAVADVLQNPHPVIQRTREALADRPASDRYNLRRPSRQGDAVDLAGESSRSPARSV